MNRATKEFVILEWTYSPPDYFEAPIRLQRDAYSIAIADGKVEVRIEAALYGHDPLLHDVLHDAVNDWFLGAQLASRRAYKLSNSVVTRVYFDAVADKPQGPRAERARPSAVEAAAARPRNGAGTGKTEPKHEPTMAELADTYSSTDPLLDSLLRRYDQAVTHPTQEIAQLCGVPEALAAIFGAQNAALAALGLSEAEWSRLTELADLERERARAGQGGSPAQSQVSESERGEARAIALRMILAYLRFTQAKAATPSP
jgi:hypothetical protein